MSGMSHALSRHEYLMKQCLMGKAAMVDRPLSQTFGYLLGEGNEITGNLGMQQIADAFIALVDSMLTTDLADGPADAGMTFFGQFVDHDVTFDTASAIGQTIDPRSIRNVRTPGLDLDCVYGDGPDASPYLYHPEKDGVPKGFLLYGRPDYHHDLARNGKGTALIGDPRNDENILVSQIQGAFVCLHNLLMSHVTDGGEAKHAVQAAAAMSIRHAAWHEAVPPALKSFEEVRRYVRLHYQWLVLHQLLPAFVDQDCIDAALAKPYVFGDKSAIMPAEFSGAAYRFGHATVQPSYVLKPGQAPRDLFAMMKAFSVRTEEDEIAMAQFFDTGGGSAQKALPVGIRMAETLFHLPEGIVRSGEVWGEGPEAVEIPVEQARKLGLRNILRDRTALRLASGQQVARWLDRHAPHLGISERPAPEILRDRHVTKTPLWFYCLEEADGGGKLTGVGGTIVAQVMVRLLREDPESILNTEFTPWEAFGGSDMTMGRVMAWVEEHRDHVAHAEKLRCG